MILSENIVREQEADCLWQLMHQLSRKSDDGEETEVKMLQRQGLYLLSKLKELQQPHLVQEYLKMVEGVNKSNIYKSTSIFIFFNKRYANKIKFIVILFLQFLVKRDFFPLRLELLQNGQFFLEFQSNLDNKVFSMINLEIIAMLFRKTIHLHSFSTHRQLETLLISGKELYPERQTRLDSLVQEFVQQQSSSFNFDFPVRELHLFRTKGGAFSALINEQTKDTVEFIQSTLIKTIMDRITTHINKNTKRKQESSEQTSFMNNDMRMYSRPHYQTFANLDDATSNTISKLHKKDAQYNQYDDISSLYVKSLKNIQSTGVLNFQPHQLNQKGPKRNEISRQIPINSQASLEHYDDISNIPNFQSMQQISRPPGAMPSYQQQYPARFAQQKQQQPLGPPPGFAMQDLQMNNSPFYYGKIKEINPQQGFIQPQNSNDRVYFDTQAFLNYNFQGCIIQVEQLANVAVRYRVMHSQMGPMATQITITDKGFFERLSLMI